MTAGNNLLMPGTTGQSDQIIAAVKSGQLSEKVLDDNVAGILNVILGSPSFSNYKYSDQPDLKKDAQVSRQAATEGMVLLKNEPGTLPIKKDVHHVAVFGIDGYELIAGGTGSGDVNKAYKVSLIQGLVNAGYTPDEDVKSAYTVYLADYATKHPKKSFIQEFMNPTPPAPEYAFDPGMIGKKAAATDMAVIAIGRNAGEGKDRKVEGDYELTDAELALIKNVARAYHAQHKKVVVVLNIGGVIDVMPWRDNADAILLAWQPGLEGGNAMADILSGKVNPSGKLATTFPVAYTDVPSAKNFPGKEFPEKATTGMFGMKAIPAEVTYEEGIYVGYRYYNTFKVKTAYEFGYGLSYTSFDYSNLSLSSSTFNGALMAKVTITNTGKIAGKEAVQLYLSAPHRQLDKPAEELKAFGKTGLLQPGQSQTLTFTLTPGDLASFDAASSSWRAEAGKYVVRVGASSLDIRQTADFTVGSDMVVEKVNKVLVPVVGIEEMKGK
jgi:beta-glucosidase